MPKRTTTTAAKPLTILQKAFVEAYLRPGDTYGNATRSAQYAGYKGTTNTLAVVGQENLRKPAIAREIEKRRNEFAAETDVLREKCLAKLIAIVDDPDTRPGDASRAIEVMAKMSGWNSETHKLESSDRQRELDAAQREFARRAALSMYDRRMLPDGPAAEIEADPVGDGDNEADVDSDQQGDDYEN